MQNATRFLAALLMLLLVGTANAQEILDEPAWQIAPADVDWLSAASTVRGGAVNPVTGHLLIPSRETPLSVQVLNSADGSSVGTLNVTGIDGGVFTLNKIAVTSDGKIFASNLQTATAASDPIKIYYWADENAAPVVVYNGAPATGRFGDSFNVSGSGDDVVAYLSGGGSQTNIAIFEWSGSAFGNPRLISVPANAAQTGLVKVTGEDSLWINNPVGGALRKISLADGTVGTTLDGDVVHTYLGELAEFHIDGRTYLAVGPGRHDEASFLESRVVILDVTDIENIEVVAETTRWGTTDNRFAPGGFVTFDEANSQLIAGVTQNAIRAFSLDFLLPEEPFVPGDDLIAFWAQNDNEISPGTFGFQEGDFPQSPDYGSGALTVGGGDLLNTTEAGVYRWIPSFAGTTLNALHEGVEAGGTISFQGGTGGIANNGSWFQVEFSADGYEDVEFSFAVRGTNTGFRNNQVSYSTDGVNFTNVGAPFDPVDGSNFSVFTFDFEGALDHAETAYVRVTLDGASGETGNNRYDNITLTGTPADAPVGPEILDDPEWSIAAGDVPWFQNDLVTRGGAINPATDNVVVISRTGGVNGRILSLASGEEVGMLNITGISGGTFPLSEIAITEDGQIFGANLVVAAGSPVKIYHWRHERALPRLVFEGEIDGGTAAGGAASYRYGDGIGVYGSGNDIDVYLGGSNNDQIARLTLNEEGMLEVAARLVPEAEVQRGRYGLAPVSADRMWINSPNNRLALIDTNTGEIIDEAENQPELRAGGDLAVFELDGRTMIVTGPLFELRSAFVIAEYHGAGEFEVLYETEVLGTNPDGNNTGFAAFDARRNNVVVMATANAIASYSVGAPAMDPASAVPLISSPADDAHIVIEGSDLTPFVPMWTAVEGATAYRWELALDADFDNIVLTYDAGESSQIDLTFGDVDALLDGLEVAVGETVRAYHRAIVINGDEIVGPYSSVNLERGDVFQGELLADAIWQITPGDEPWLLPVGNHMRGGAYNPATDHLLVTSRIPALGIWILHPANGQTIGTMSVAGISGGTFPLSEISVTDDGQIFGANLHTEGQGIKIYRWADENAEPVLIWEGNLNNRAGDAFHVAGSGDDVRIYISGTFNESIAIFEWNGSATSGPRYITPQAGVDRARMGIAEVPGGESLWINGPGTALAEVSTEDGEILREVSLDVLPSGFGDLTYFVLDGREYVLAGSQDQMVNMFVVVDVTEEGEERIAYRTPSLGIYENTFFIGFAAFDDKRSNIIAGATNVTVAAFSLADHDNVAPLASELTAPADGAEIRIEGEGSTEFTATWTEATDPDDDTVLYRWQLSASPSFDDPIVDASVGTATSFTTDFATVASILDDAGVTVEGSLTVYHRVITSDGELETEGDARSVTLVRGTLTNVDSDLNLPSAFALHGNYPNPFNPTTSIRFDLPQTADVRVEIYDVLGRQVMTLAHDGMQAGASQTISVDANHLSSGTYLYRVVVEMQGTTRVETGKMLLVK